MQPWCYVGGQCNLFDWCHMYNVTFQILDRWLVRLGCDEVVRYFYKPLYVTFNGGLKGLDVEQDLYEMCVQAAKDKKVDVYVKHLRNDHDIEATEFGQRTLQRLKAAVVHWESFVESIDGSYLIYRRRGWNEEEVAPPSCSKKLFVNSSKRNNIAANSDYSGIFAFESNGSRDVLGGGGESPTYGRKSQVPESNVGDAALLEEYVFFFMRTIWLSKMMKTLQRLLENIKCDK